MNDNNTPSARYHHAYDDTHYQLIRASIVRDLGDDEPVVALMNAVTSAASDAVGWPGFEGGLTTLAVLTVAHNLSDGTVFLLTRYLARFDERESATFAARVTALRTAKAAGAPLSDAVAASSIIPGADGNAAHHLLRAAHLLTLAALALLTDDSRYAAEKLQSARRHLSDGETWVGRGKY